MFGLRPLQCNDGFTDWVQKHALAKDSYRYERNTHKLIFENLKPIDISKNHFNIFKSLNWFKFPLREQTGKTKSVFLKLHKKMFKSEFSCKSNMFYPISQLFKSKRRGLMLQNGRIYGFIIYIKIKMGVAGLIF